MHTHVHTPVTMPTYMVCELSGMPEQVHAVGVSYAVGNHCLTNPGSNIAWVQGLGCLEGFVGQLEGGKEEEKEREESGERGG